MNENNSSTFLKRIFRVVVVIGALAAGIAAFSGNLLTILKSGKEIVLNVVQGHKHVPFEIKTLVPRFAVLGTMSGEVSIEKPFLRINVLASTLRTHKEAEGYVRYVRFGLAYLKTPPKIWDVVAWSEKIEIEQLIENFSTIGIPPFETTIPIEDIKNLDGYWLVLEIGMKDEKATYMHSNPQMFVR